MIGQDQNLSDFPPWLWPYINVANLVRPELSKGQVASTAVSATPAFATISRVSAMIAAATVKRIASGIKDERLRTELSNASAAMLSDDPDDWCPTGKKWPWPRPPRKIELYELAGHAGIAAAAIGNKQISQDLGQIATNLAQQAVEA